MTAAAPQQPFVRIGPATPQSPVVISVPHAGRRYTPELLALARLPQHNLEMLEDRLADRLVWRAVEAGITAFIVEAPRAEIDLNRDPREIDPALIDPPLPPGEIIPSPRTRGGIGLIPSRIAGAGAIWNRRLPRAELTRRIADIHEPYHAALARTLRNTRERFGAAILLDCHSMPPRPPGEARIVIGDRHGTSARADLVAAAVSAAGTFGHQVALNAPYAGGYVVARHGRPGQGVHALQLEIDRASYLDVMLRAPGPGFAQTCRLVAAVAEALGARLLGTDLPLAAE